jgi:RNA polymerase sigma-70 factor (ECF subfamily)
MTLSQSPSRTRSDPFDEIYDAHFAEIRGYVARRLGVDAAEDVVAETFLTAFRKWDSYEPARGSVRSWLYGIATNLVGKHRRSEMRALRALGRRGPDPDQESPEERVSARLSAEGLRPGLAKALAGLNQGERNVLTLVALAGLSHEEIAAALGVSYGTVGSRLSRARRKVKQSLGDTNPMEELDG